MVAINKPNKGKNANCVDCDGSDLNQNGIEDCYDCSTAQWFGGCLNCPTCVNYNASANFDDGTCLGCTDPTATNYDPGSSIDNGNCNFATPDSHEQIDITICDISPNHPMFNLGWQVGTSHLLYTSGGWFCNGVTCDQNDLNQEFEFVTAAPNPPTYTLNSFNNPIVHNPSTVNDSISSTCPSPGVGIYACLCSIWQNNLGSCPPNGTGSSYLYTTNPTTISGNQPNVGDAFMPYANTKYVVDTLYPPTTSGNTNYSTTSACNYTPPQTFDCYPGQGCQVNWNGVGLYLNSTSCDAACQTTYDCDASWNCNPNYNGTGYYSGGLSAANLLQCQTTCVQFPDTYDCDASFNCNLNPTGQGFYTGATAQADCNQLCQPAPDTYDCINYNCVLNTLGQGSYTGPTAQTDCQNDPQCQPPPPEEGCADPTATPCSQMPPAMQNSIGCYEANHGGCGTPPDPNDNSCCLYQDIEPIEPDNPTGSEEIRCECCNKFNQPISMNQWYPVGFDCTTLNNPTSGLSNCDKSPISGGPGAQGCEADCDFFYTNFSHQNQITYCEVCEFGNPSPSQSTYCDCCPTLIKERFQKLANISKK